MNLRLSCLFMTQKQQLFSIIQKIKLNFRIASDLKCRHHRIKLSDAFKILGYNRIGKMIPIGHVGPKFMQENAALLIFDQKHVLMQYECFEWGGCTVNPDKFRMNSVFLLLR